MKAEPKVGDSYREEYYAGQAEDRADILSLSESVTVPFGSFTNCLKTKNYTLLEPDVVEHKYYCKEAGNTMLEIDLDGSERMELLSIKNNVKLSNRNKQTPATKVDTSSPGTTTLLPQTTITVSPAPPTLDNPQVDIKTNITEEQAKTIALQRVPGKVTDITVEKKFGKTAYVVEIDADEGEETDVVVDRSTGEILGLE